MLPPRAPKFRIKVRIDDNKPYFKFGPAYPHKDISELIKWIRDHHEKNKESKDQEIEEFFFLNKILGNAYATVTFINEFDGEIEPIVEFSSEII